MSPPKRLQALCAFLALCVCACGSPPERHLRDFELSRIRLGALRPVVLDSTDSVALLAYGRGIGDTVFLKLREAPGSVRVSDSVLPCDARYCHRYFWRGNFVLEFSVFKHNAPGDTTFRAIVRLADYFTHPRQF